MVQARELLTSGEKARALALSRNHWLKHPSDAEPAKLLSELMKSEGQDELASYLSAIATTGSGTSKDVQNLFEAGFKLLDVREPHLAAMLLRRAAELRPDEAVIAYELGFALMTIRRFTEAIPHLERASGETRDFDTWLNLSVCYTLTRNLEKAKNMLGTMSEMASNEDEHAELVHRKGVLKRLERLSKRTELTSRDWLYILYGSMLLGKGEPTGKASLVLDAPGLRQAPGGKSEDDKTIFKDATAGTAAGTIDYKEIAKTLLVLKQVFYALGVDIEIIEYYSLLSKPLAEALGRIMDLPVDIYKGPDRVDKALLVMAWASNIIGPHKTFIPTSPKRILFAYGLTASASLPLTPDIIAMIADYCRMPWASTSEENADEFADAANLDLPDEKLVVVVETILQEVARLESLPDTILLSQEIAGYYDSKRDLLVLGNSDTFPNRAQYTAEIPF